MHTFLLNGGLSHTPKLQLAYIDADVQQLPSIRSDQASYQKNIKMGNCCESASNFFGPQKNTNVRVSLPAVCFVWQIAMIVLFGVFIRYDEESDAHWVELKKTENLTDLQNEFYFRYPSK